MQAPPTSSTKPKPAPPKPTSASYNPFETLKDQGREALNDIAKAPQELVQQAAEAMWKDILGFEPSKKRQEGEKEPDSFTKLNMEKLNAAYARQDMGAVEQIQQNLQQHQEQIQLNAVRHKQVKQAEEKAVYDLEREEEERKKKLMEEEQQKKQEEEEERQAQMADSNDGAAKSKAGIGQARKKASTDTIFEQGRKKS